MRVARCPGDRQPVCSPPAGPPATCGDLRQLSSPPGDLRQLSSHPGDLRQLSGTGTARTLPQVESRRGAHRRPVICLASNARLAPSTDPSRFGVDFRQCQRSFWPCAHYHWLACRRCLAASRSRMRHGPRTASSRARRRAPRGGTTTASGVCSGPACGSPWQAQSCGIEMSRRVPGSAHERSSSRPHSSPATTPPGNCGSSPSRRGCTGSGTSSGGPDRCARIVCRSVPASRSRCVA